MCSNVEVGLHQPVCRLTADHLAIAQGSATAVPGKKIWIRCDQIYKGITLLTARHELASPFYRLLCFTDLSKEYGSNDELREAI